MFLFTSLIWSVWLPRHTTTQIPRWDPTVNLLDMPHFYVSIPSHSLALKCLEQFTATALFFYFSILYRVKNSTQCGILNIVNKLIVVFPLSNIWPVLWDASTFVFHVFEKSLILLFLVKARYTAKLKKIRLAKFVCLNASRIFVLCRIKWKHIDIHSNF